MNTGRALGGMIAALALVWLVGCGALGTASMDDGLPAGTTRSSIGPLADAVTMGYARGANLVQWGAAGDRVVAYLIYRSDNPVTPIAVDDGTCQFIDAATALPVGQQAEAWEVVITLAPETGRVTITRTPGDGTSAVGGGVTTTDTTITADCRRTPLQPGTAYGYALTTVVVDADPGAINDPLHFNKQYRLLTGTRSIIATPFPAIAPPVATALNGQMPAGGTFRCAAVPGATAYVLQLSPEPTFAAGTTLAVPGEAPGWDSDVLASVDTAALSAALRLTAGQRVFWRMGARAAGYPLPIALQGASQDGWVYSAQQSFLLPASPPPAP